MPLNLHSPAPLADLALQCPPKTHVHLCFKSTSCLFYQNLRLKITPQSEWMGPLRYCWVCTCVKKETPENGVFFCDYGLISRNRFFVFFVFLNLASLWGEIWCEICLGVLKLKLFRGYFWNLCSSKCPPSPGTDTQQQCEVSLTSVPTKDCTYCKTKTF